MRFFVAVANPTIDLCGVGIMVNEIFRALCVCNVLESLQYA